MITIIVGVPGAGKTLYACSKLREEYQGRQVYYHNIPAVTIDEWLELGDPYQWHLKPEGSVCIVDEAHEVFPKRDYKIKEPEHIEAAATLRHRGHDLVLLTQHPNDLDIFLRRRCARFIYLKSPLSKGNYALAWEWGEYNEKYKDEREMQKANNFRFDFPPSAFGTYKSACVHTKKKYIPKALKKAIVMSAVALCCAVGAFMWLFNSFTNGGSGTAVASTVVPSAAVEATTPIDHLSKYMPRVQSLPHTAPIYDNVTKAVTFPRLQCIASDSRCVCYTQQATREYVSEKVCRKMVSDGIFDFTRKDGGLNHGAI